MRGANRFKTDRARRLRRNSTKAEWKLWYRLRARSLAGYKFVRQEPLGPYVVDFVCREKRLIVELDGGQHAQSNHDFRRDRYTRNVFACYAFGTTTSLATWMACWPQF